MKKYVAMLLALVMVFALCACGSNGDKAADDNNGDYHLVLKLSHVFQPNEQLTIEMQQVAQRIKERTNGAIEIQCYDSGQLATYKDNVEQVVNGADWIACEDPSYLADYDIDFEALIGPMMYNSIDEYSYVCQSDLVKGMCQKLEDNYGIHVLALDFNVGMRCLQTNKVIKTPADLKGMKIRVPNSSMYINCLTAMGATPTGMPFSETISAVQQGVIDGLEGNMNAYSTNGSAEVCKNMSLTNHLVVTFGAYISTKVWNSIPEEYRTIIQEEFTKGAKELTDFTNASFDETKAKLEKEQGCSFNEVDVDAFRAAVQPEFDRMVKEKTPEKLPILYAHADDEDGAMVRKQILSGDIHTEFVAVRFGNVLGSNGSVIPLFKKQIAAGGPVTVTHPDIIRYFMTIPEAVSLVLQAGTYAKGGEIFVLDMGSPVKIDTLARNLIKLSGLKPDVDIRVEYTGLRPGEKLYEEKLMAEEGLKKTPNSLIHVGCPIPFETDVFLEQMQSLMEAAYTNDEHIREKVAEIVTTYHPAGKNGSEEKGEVYERLLDQSAKTQELRQQKRNQILSEGQ